jgi:hypothetical protein
MITTIYCVKRNEETDFEELNNTTDTQYEFTELFDGKLLVEKTVKIDEYTTRVSKLCYKGKNWFKLLYDVNDVKLNEEK